MYNLNVNNNYPNRMPNFKAVPLAEYGYLRKKADRVVIYQLEKTDIGYLQSILNKLESFYKKYDVDNESARQVIKEAFEASVKILEGKHNPEEKAKILMAFYNDQPSSILVGNALKVDKDGGFHYSSRKNHAQNETELDWLATWNKKIRGEGQATVYEYFYTLLKDGFKQCFVRSELLGKSSAVDFYTKMGFEKLSDIPRKILRKNDNQYLIGTFDDLEDEIIPMKATVMDMINTIKAKSKSIMRKEIETKVSVKLPEEKW